MRSLYLECYSGISGDMTVGALLDLGADQKVLEKALASLPIQGFQTEVTRVKKSALDACDFLVKLDAEHENHDHNMNYLYGHHHGEEHHEHCHDHVHDDDHSHTHEHDDHDAHGEETHDHHHHHHGHDADEVFVSVGVETANRYEQDEVKAMLDKLSDEEEYGTVLRAKGVLQNAAGDWFQFDYVPGESQFRPGTPDYTGRLCVIGAHIDEKALRELFKA